jgi:ATP-dependent DNA ligase
MQCSITHLSERRMAAGVSLRVLTPRKMGLEGIVSKWRDSCYRSGRSPDWINSKNPNAPAVKREAEEDWGR